MFSLLQTEISRSKGSQVVASSTQGSLVPSSKGQEPIQPLDVEQLLPQIRSKKNSERSQGELNLSLKLSTQSESTSKRSSRHQRTYHTGTHLGDLHGLSKSKALQKTLECLEQAKLQRGRLKLIVGKVSGNLSRTLLLVNLLTRSLGDCLSSLGRDFILEMESQFSSQSSLL